MVIETGKGAPFDMAQDPMDGLDHLPIVVGNQTIGLTVALCPAGAADPVNIELWGSRHVKVDDMGDVGDVDAAGCDIGGDQHLIFTGFESAHGVLTLGLGQISLQCGRKETGLGQFGAELFGAVFGSRENQNGIGLRVAEQLEQQRGL